MLLILFFLLIIIASLKIRVNFNKIKISNINEDGQKVELKKTYNVNFELIILGITKVARIEFNNKKSRNALQRIKDKIGNMSNDMLNPKELIKRLREFKVRIKKANIKLMVGTEEMLATIGLVTLISSIIPIWLRNKFGVKNSSYLQYRIAPIYNHGNVIDLEAQGIIEVYFVHIIYALYIIKMKGRNKYARRKQPKSSYRRSYDYSNG